MTNISANYQPNYINAIGTAIVGGSAWGLGQYLFNKKPFVDSAGNIRDAFVKNMEEAMVAIKDSATLENINLQKQIEKDIEILKSKEELIDFVKKRKNDFMRVADDDLKLLETEIGKMELTEGKSFVKDVFKSDGKYQKYYKDLLDSCYDSHGKLNHDSAKISQQNWKTLKSVINKARINSALKAAGIFTAVCAGCCCFFEFFVAKRKS